MKQETKYSLRSLKFTVYSFKFSSGQSLIEVLIAFTVSVVIGMALVSAGLATQRASISARNKSQATKLAQQYLEEVRLMRDVKGFSSFLQFGCWTIKTTDSGGVESTDPLVWSLTYMFASNAACIGDTFYATDDKVTINNTVFDRRLAFTAITPSVSTKVVVKVLWKEGTNTRGVKAETVLSKWCEGAVDPLNTTCP